MTQTKRSRELFKEAQRYLVGGVNSPVRAFKAVGGNPLFIKCGKGSKIFDEDANEYIDYVGSWGPLILGHSHPEVIRAIKQTAGDGASFGAPTELEITLAKMVSSALPSVELVRFVSSGTEAVMSAIRLARASTGRDKVVKFVGSYHGHSDGLLAQAGSGMATLGIPGSPGVPSSFAAQTLLVPYNDLKAVEQLFQDFGQDIAALIVEPVAANMGVVMPLAGFLEGLRKLTHDAGALLIFDEVVTGFRLAFGGAQSLFGVTPDITCLGKIIGGGLPVGAYGGRKGVMEMIAPVGSVYQAGTLSGNPLSMTAGIQTLKALHEPQVYVDLENKSSLLAEGIVEAADRNGISIQLNRAGSMFTIFFSGRPVVDYETASGSDSGLYAEFFRRMLSQGVYLPPSQFEANFVSTAHTEADVEFTLNAIQRAFKSLK